MTTTDQGKKVPFIVRLETGWQDRDVFHIAVLFDPAKPWTAVNPQPAWNHKVLVTQGAGCGAHYGEGDPTLSTPSPLATNHPGAVLVDQVLARGFAVMSTALSNSTHNCNVAVQAESVVMAKEHLIDNYGEIRYTIAQGGSGGSLSQYQDANAYPGIYQGLLPSQTFPDAWSSGMNPYDCFLMENYWNNPSTWSPGVTWTPQQRAAVAGSDTDSVCLAWTKLFPFYPTFYPQLASPDDSKGGLLDLQNCGLPRTQTFDTVLNPKGVRCALSDVMVNVFGRRPDGKANRPLDNVGIEYGLKALQAGAISPAQFADLNAKVGSRDIDWQQQAKRAAAEPAGLVNAYRSGAVMEANNLDQVAVIDLSAGTTDIHESWRAFAIRARMDAAYGHHKNDVIWYTSGSTPNPFLTIDKWLARVEADHRPLPLSAKIVADKPAEAVDHVDKPYFLGTRGAAGMPGPRDTNKCTLKPLRRAEYKATFDDASWTAFTSAFPTGVCDWSKPGFGQRRTIPWLQYGDAKTHIYGGKPLGPAPVSQAFAATAGAGAAPTAVGSLPTTGMADSITAVGLLAMLAAGLGWRSQRRLRTGAL